MPCPACIADVGGSDCLRAVRLTDARALPRSRPTEPRKLLQDASATAAGEAAATGDEGGGQATAAGEAGATATGGGAAQASAAGNATAGGGGATASSVAQAIAQGGSAAARAVSQAVAGNRSQALASERAGARSRGHQPQGTGISRKAQACTCGHPQAATLLYTPQLAPSLAPPHPQAEWPKP